MSCYDPIGVKLRNFVQWLWRKISFCPLDVNKQACGLRATGSQTTILKGSLHFLERVYSMQCLLALKNSEALLAALLLL